MSGGEARWEKVDRNTDTSAGREMVAKGDYAGTRRRERLRKGL
jgi:hypothetical protein